MAQNGGILEIPITGQIDGVDCYIDNLTEHKIAHGRIVSGGNVRRMSFLRCDSCDDCNSILENLWSKDLELKEYKSVFITVYGSIKLFDSCWLVVDPVDCSLFTYVNGQDIWDGKRLRPSCRRIIRDLIKGFYALSLAQIAHGFFNGFDIMIVNGRAKLAFVSGKSFKGKIGWEGARNADLKALHGLLIDLLGRDVTNLELKHFLQQDVRMGLWHHPLLMTDLQRYILPISVQLSSSLFQICRVNSSTDWRERVQTKSESTGAFHFAYLLHETSYSATLASRNQYISNASNHINDQRIKKELNSNGWRSDDVQLKEILAFFSENFEDYLICLIDILEIEFIFSN